MHRKRRSTASVKREAYMESIHYNKLFTQKVQHQAFIEKLDEFMESHNKEEENQGWADSTGMI